MKKPVCLLFASILLCGCFAIVDDSSGERKVRSFIITNDETIDHLEKIDAKEQEDQEDKDLDGEVRW